MPNHFVYIIQAKTMRLLKFGRTSNVKRRLMDLQLGSPDELAVLWTSGPMDFDQSVRAEAFLHNRLDAFHVRGEWYSPEKEVIELVEGLMGVAPSSMAGTDIRLLEAIASHTVLELQPESTAPRKIFPRIQKFRKPHRNAKRREKDYAMGNTSDGRTIFLSEAERRRKGK